MTVGDLVPFAPPGRACRSSPSRWGSARSAVSDRTACSARHASSRISQEHESGILILPAEIPLGSDVKSALGLDDVVLDLEIESNRPDLLSIVGPLARSPVRPGSRCRRPTCRCPKVTVTQRRRATVEIEDAEGCPRYLARILRGVGGGHTPLSVQARLTACGTRPISPIVDATNYVMLERGQPLHAFDLDRLAGPAIVVERSTRRAPDDARRHRARTGRRSPHLRSRWTGRHRRRHRGAGSEVDGETRNVLLEARSSSGGPCLRTSRRLQLLTEASTRFSRGATPRGWRTRPLGRAG